jgi:hypothetical protein
LGAEEAVGIGVQTGKHRVHQRGREGGGRGLAEVAAAEPSDSGRGLLRRRTAARAEKIVNVRLRKPVAIARAARKSKERKGWSEQEHLGAA